MQTKTIQEGLATITISSETKISKQLNVFYNPVMKTNRDLSIAVLNAWSKKDLHICDLMAASGTRSIRFFLELEKNKIKHITINDYSKKAIKSIKDNLKQNKLEKNKKITITCKDADIMLLESTGFDYIDIDPFGTPVVFLDAACKRLSRDSILAITATDTSSLAGTYPKTCKRNYDAIPLHTGIMHEIGIRILIRKCQLVAAQYNKALTPILSYFKDHYYRVFFECHKGRQKADAIMQQHGTITVKNETIGPLWKGRLWDTAFVATMHTEQKESQRFLDVLKKEMTIQHLGFYDIHALCKEEHVQIPRYDRLFAAIEKTGNAVTRTHFSLEGITSTIGEQALREIIKSLS